MKLVKSKAEFFQTKFTSVKLKLHRRIVPTKGNFLEKPIGLHDVPIPTNCCINSTLLSKMEFNFRRQSSHVQI